MSYWRSLNTLHLRLGGSIMQRSDGILPAPEEYFEIPGLPAETFPPLRDRPEYEAVIDIVDVQDVEVESVAPPISENRVAELLATASEDDLVRKLLGESFIGIGVRVVPLKEGRDDLLAMFYSYSSQWTVEARLNDDGGVLEAETSRVQPALTEEEFGLAVELARDALGGDIGDLAAGGIAITTGYEHELADRRLIDVRFFEPAERLPRYRALIDLADRVVVESGRVPRKGGEDNG